MVVFEFLSENPKLTQRRIASGSIPPPSSSSGEVKLQLCITQFLFLSSGGCKEKPLMNS